MAYNCYLASVFCLSSIFWFVNNESEPLQTFQINHTVSFAVFGFCMYSTIWQFFIWRPSSHLCSVLSSCFQRGHKPNRRGEIKIIVFPISYLEFWGIHLGEKWEINSLNVRVASYRKAYFHVQPEAYPALPPLIFWHTFSPSPFLNGCLKCWESVVFLSLTPKSWRFGEVYKSASSFFVTVWTFHLKCLGNALQGRGTADTVQYP